jgi:hypothetical protein
MFDTPITVFFSCKECGARYQAKQEPCHEERFGSFDCWECKSEIYRWSGALEYVDWDFVLSWG